jgi:uncharacterized protein YcfJ
MRSRTIAAFALGCSLLGWPAADTVSAAPLVRHRVVHRRVVRTHYVAPRHRVVVHRVHRVRPVRHRYHRSAAKTAAVIGGATAAGAGVGAVVGGKKGAVIGGAAGAAGGTAYEVHKRRKHRRYR